MMDKFQQRVAIWVVETFGIEALVPKERSMRVVEEALELAQAAGLARNHLHALVEYVYNRPVGEVSQELAGVAVTMFAAAASFGVNLEAVTEQEITRIETKDPEKFRKRNKEKQDAGMGFISHA